MTSPAALAIPLAPPAFRDASLPLPERVRDLVSRLTLEEKASQMLHQSREVPRLGIPAYNWWNECLHGVARNGRATVFPQPIGLGATFNVELLERIAAAIAEEARAKHHAALRLGNRGQNAGLTFWTPTVNILRDPRWGRGHESYGEDPYLTGELGAAFVRGLQGNDPRYLKASACAKHFAVHSGPEKDRHHFNAVVSQKDLHETYLPAFKRLVEAGVESVMGAYNRTNGEPCCGSPTLLAGILRGDWGFEGHVISDCWAIEDFHTNHHATAGPLESVALAVKNSCDLCCGHLYEHLLEAVKAGLLEEGDLDKCVTRLLTTRFKLGMFDAPELVPFASTPVSVINCAEHRELAREAAAQSIVLLKNADNLLPLGNRFRKILVVGPNATSVDALMGSYSGMSTPMITVLEGIVGQVPEGITVDYRMGCHLEQEAANPTDWSMHEAKTSDLIIAVMGLTTLVEGEEGDALSSALLGDREDIALPPNQAAYLERLSRVGKPVIVVFLAGNALAIPRVADSANAILYAWYPGEEGGNAVADILFGSVSPAGRLPLTIPRSVGHLPPYADYAMAGRTYKYMEEDPLYPFGFGLSYSTFSYENLKLARLELACGESLPVTVTLTNTGDATADEVAQLYLTDLEASVAVPKYKLIAFQRLTLTPGETASLVFTISPDDMSLVNEAGELLLEPGAFLLHAGGCSPGPRGQELGAAPLVTARFTLSAPDKERDRPRSHGVDSAANG